MRIGGLEALVCLAAILLFFGASRLPKLSEAAGKSVRIFRKAAHDDSEEIDNGETSETED